MHFSIIVFSSRSGGSLPAHAATQIDGWPGLAFVDLELDLSAPPLLRARMRVTFDGKLAQGVTAKDMILKLIGAHSASGGIGYAIEFAGQAVRELEIEARLTLCNMTVEFGAFSGLVAPDEKTFDYVKGRPFAPNEDQWDQAVSYWRSLNTDKDASFDKC